LTPDVIVIGGGFAGLSAATALAERGAQVLVVEARPALGGRATAFTDPATGERVDNGQHVLFGCYRETFRFLQRIGAENNVAVQPTLEVPYLDRDGSRSVLRCPRWPSPLHLLGGVLGWDALPWSERLGALRLAPDLRRPRRSFRAETEVAGAETVAADETVSAWLTRRGQRGRIREWLWEPLAIAALNQSPDEASAGPFVRVLAEMFGGRRTDASMVLPLRPLGEMYALPASRYIESRGGEVRVNALARIAIANGRVVGVTVRGETVAVTRVIAAVPWFALETLLTGAPPAAMTAIVSAATRMASKPIVTVNLWYDRTVMEDAFVGLPGRRMQWAFDKRRAFGERAAHLSLVASGADALAAEDRGALVALAAREVAAAIPGARDAVLLRGTVVREKRATFSLAPGQPPRPGVDTPVAGLFLAGDWIETGLPGTIESAAIAGHRAARSAIGNK
jgi:zeta-carotene desaturase